MKHFFSEIFDEFFLEDLAGILRIASLVLIGIAAMFGAIWVPCFLIWLFFFKT